MDKKKKYFARRITDYIGTIVLISLIVFFWQLYRSPIPLPFLKPYIIKALNHDSQEYNVEVESVNLELVRSIQPIKIIARNVTYNQTNGGMAIQAPRIEISFSIRALIRGIISPSSVVFHKPKVEIFTNYGTTSTEKSELSLNERKIGYYLRSFQRFVERFNSKDLSYPESYINYIAIKDADYEFTEVDLERKWSVSNANYVFERQEDGLSLNLTGKIILGKADFPFDIKVNYDTLDKKIKLSSKFVDFIPSKALEMFKIEGEDKNLLKIDIPIDGNLETVIDFGKVLRNRGNVIKSLDNAIESVNFQFSGKDGNLIFSENNLYDYNINAFSLIGEIDSSLNEIKIKNAKLDMGEKSAFVSVYVTGFKDLLLKNSIKNLKIKLTTEVARLNFEELPRYWPRYVAEDAWLWVKEGIYTGIIKDASFDFNFGYAEKTKSIGFISLNGQGSVENASLNYLEGMPHATGVYGTAKFFTDKIVIDVDKGTAGGNVLKKGKVVLYDLDKYNNYIDISLVASSSIQNAVKLINSPPFEFLNEMGINPDILSGKADVDLNLNFELKKDLLAKEIKVDVKAKLYDVLVKDIVDGKSITSEQLTLIVNNESLKVDGNVDVDGVPLNVKWTNLFYGKTYTSIYDLSFIFTETIKKKFNLDYGLLNSPYFIGEPKVDVKIYEYPKSKYEIDVSSNLLDVKMNYPFFNFLKENNEEANLSLKINVEKGAIESIKDVKLSNKELDVEGFMLLNKKGEFETIEFTKIKGPRINAKSKISISSVNGKSNIKANISGISYDISKLFEMGIEDSKRDKKGKDFSSYMGEIPNVDVNIAVDSLWTNDEIPITNFAGYAKIINGIGINEVKLIGNYAHDKASNFSFEYSPRPNDDHIINVKSSDAGKTLKVLRLYSNMVGGDLTITARRNADGAVIGHAKVRSFYIVNKSVLAKVISMASLTGIVNTISGDGIAFSYFDSPFEFKNGIFKLQETRAFGDVLGITTQGYYDYNTNKLDLSGVLAPAYSLNRFLARIPLIGWMLAGKDGTVFAADYTVTGTAEDPKIKISPSSTVTPNSVKDIFRKNEE